MTIYIWFVVQQMYVSLTYPYNIVQHTLSYIEHRKLDSLATPYNIREFKISQRGQGRERQETVQFKRSH